MRELFADAPARNMILNIYSGALTCAFDPPITRRLRSASDITSVLVLYGLSQSVYTRIARLALEEKCVLYRLEEIDIFAATGKPPGHLERHPFGRIPALAHNKFRLFETGAITRYVDEAFSGPVLQPAAPIVRARMNQIISIMDSYAYAPMVWSVFVQRIAVPARGGRPNRRTIAQALPTIEVCLKTLDGFLGTHRFFVDDVVTLADLHVAPMLAYFALTREGKQMIRGYRSLKHWLNNMKRRPSMQSTRSIYELQDEEDTDTGVAVVD